MIPVPSGKQPGTEEAAMKYGYKQAANTPGALMAGKFTPTKLLRTWRLTRKRGLFGCHGQIQGRGLLLLPGGLHADCGEKAADVVCMPLYRNHKYVVTITDAEGIGCKNYLGRLFTHQGYCRARRHPF